MTHSLEQPGENLSDERLAYMIERQREGYLTITTAEILSVLTELQALRSTPAEMEAVAWINAATLRHHIESGAKQTTAVLHSSQGVLYGENDTPIYASPAEAVVTDAMVEHETFRDWWDRDQAGGGFDLTTRNVANAAWHAALTVSPPREREIAVTDEMIEDARKVIGPRISRKNMRAALTAALQQRGGE